MLGRIVRGALGAAAAVALGLVATTHRDVPRCPAGLVALGARCCGEGQTLTHDETGERCTGAPSRCSDRLERTDVGCVAPRRRAIIRGGSSSWHPPDTTIAPVGETAVTKTFELDAYEVTWSSWQRCVDANACGALVGGDAGQAVHSVTRDEARAFCRFAGGRLPRDGEWLRAAIGDVETRYPWGDPDALCLRAAFALDGRCARGARSPDTAGARPWGATKDGAEDLAGNVAEWVEEGAPVGMAIVRGGSWAEPDATSLRPRWRRVLDPGARKPWVGLRCAFDL